MSLMAARAGELRPEAGEREDCELKLMVERVDLRTRLWSDSRASAGATGVYAVESGKALRVGTWAEGERT